MEYEYSEDDGYAVNEHFGDQLPVETGWIYVIGDRPVYVPDPEAPHVVALRAARAAARAAAVRERIGAGEWTETTARAPMNSAVCEVELATGETMLARWANVGWSPVNGFIAPSISGTRWRPFVAPGVS